MRVVRVILYSALALIGALAIMVFSCERFENPRSYFDTYAEMEAAGWIERGWIPTYLPRSATEIFETHDIDTNEGRVTFRFERGDTETAESACRLIVQSAEAKELLCPPFEDETNILTLGSDGTGRLLSSPRGM